MVLNEVLATEQIGFPILSVLLFLPVAFLIILGFVRNETLAYRIGLAGAMLELILATVLAYRFNSQIADF